jgi:TRAP-type C4-dicarboxylate transport system permease small subunit
MISTVTTSTVSTVTTAALAGSVALVGIIVLLVLLLQKEISSAGEGSRYRTLSRALNFAIAPLLIAFVLVVFARVVEVLR